MTSYTWPSNVNPSSAALSWVDNTARFRSPLVGTVRTESRAGGHWAMSITVSGLMNESIISNPLHEIEAYLFKLNGAEHRATIHDFAYVRSGPGGGTPRVNGASQTGLTLATDGWPINTTVLYAGDRIGVSGQMLVLANDATTGEAGGVTMTLAHPIRTAPATDSEIEIDAPTASYILKNNASFSSVPGVVKSVLVEFEEDLT